jgi:hypothetical protein
LPDRSNLRSPMPRRRKSLFGQLIRLVLIFALAGGFLLLVTAVFAPWAYYLGGHFHAIPYWQGWGRMHVASAGGDYVVFARMEPSSRSSKMYLSTNLRGVGYLCTPKGERFRLSLGGSMAKHLPVDTTGQPISLYMSNSPLWTGPYITDHRPSLNFYGNWGDRELVLDDHHSLSTVFLPDGTVYRQHDRDHPMGKETAHVTLREGSYADFEAACRSR